MGNARSGVFCDIGLSASCVRARVDKWHKKMKTSIAVKKEVSAAYDSQVSVYEARRFSGVGGKLFDQLERLHAVSWLRKCNVLHVGTATGMFAEMLPTRGWDYYGIEISR